MNRLSGVLGLASTFTDTSAHAPSESLCARGARGRVIDEDAAVQGAGKCLGIISQILAFPSPTQ